MEAVKKYWFWGIFISILSIFAMSHNANAVEAVFDISNYDLVGQYISQSLICSYNDDITTTGASCSLNATRNTLNSITFPARNYEDGDIIQFDLIASSYSSFTTGESANGYFSTPYRTPYIVVNPDFRTLSIDTIQFETNDRLINYYNEWNCRVQGTADNCTGYPELTNSGVNYQVFRITLRIRRKITNGSLVISGGNTINDYFLYLPGYNIGNNSSPILITRFNIWRATETKENKEVEEKTQNAVDDSQAAGGSSSSDAQTGTTGLLNAITGAVNVISAARPTNCKINGNMGNLDMGQLDLCANPAPAFIQTIGSLILILMCVPLAISLFNRFIAIFRSFQS